LTQIHLTQHQGLRPAYAAGGGGEAVVPYHQSLQERLMSIRMTSQQLQI
jgi:hypothetical protein